MLHIRRKRKHKLLTILVLIVSLLTPMATYANEPESYDEIETIETEETTVEDTNTDTDVTEMEPETVQESITEEVVMESDITETDDETGEEEFSEDGPFILGNISENILNGGILALDDHGNIYFSNTEDDQKLYLSAGDQSSLLVSEASANINIYENMVYYTTMSGTLIRA